MSTAFGDVVSHTIGGGWGTETVNDGSVAIRVLRGADFPEAEMNKTSSFPLRFEPAKKVATRELHEGDIVLETSGGTRDRPTGRTIFASSRLLSASREPIIPASFCRLIRIDDRKAFPLFVYYALQDLYRRGGTWEYQNTSTGISNFQYELFQRSFTLPSVTLREQQSIAEVLGALDEKIAANAALAATSEKLLRTEVDAMWLHGSHRDATLSEFVEFNPATFKPTEAKALYIDMKKLPESGWSIDAPERRAPKGGARFRRGDTLLARITPCLENRKTGFVDNIADEQIAIGSTEFIVLRAREGIATPIPFFLATEDRFREFAIQNMVGTSGRQRVAAADLARFEMPAPDKEWLAGFSTLALTIFAQVESQRAESLTLAATRDALLPQLMSGKVRVRDAEAAASAAGA